MMFDHHKFRKLDALARQIAQEEDPEKLLQTKLHPPAQPCFQSLSRRTVHISVIRDLRSGA